MRARGHCASVQSPNQKEKFPSQSFLGFWTISRLRSLSVPLVPTFWDHLLLICEQVERYLRAFSLDNRLKKCPNFCHRSTASLTNMKIQTGCGRKSDYARWEWIGSSELLLKVKRLVNAGTSPQAEGCFHAMEKHKERAVVAWDVNVTRAA